MGVEDPNEEGWGDDDLFDLEEWEDF